MAVLRESVPVFSWIERTIVCEIRKERLPGYLPSVWTRDAGGTRAPTRVCLAALDASGSASPFTADSSTLTHAHNHVRTNEKLQAVTRVSRV